MLVDRTDFGRCLQHWRLPGARGRRAQQRAETALGLRTLRTYALTKGLRPLLPKRGLRQKLRGVPAISSPRMDAGCWVGALDPAPRSALRSCQPGAARCRWRLESSLIQHPATQPSSLSTQRIQPLGAWVEAGSSRRAPGWVMYMGTGSSLGEAGLQGPGFGWNANQQTSQVKSSPSAARARPPLLCPRAPAGGSRRSTYGSAW